MIKFNTRYKLKILQAYAPASTDNDGVEHFYEDVKETTRNQETVFNNRGKFEC